MGSAEDSTDEVGERIVEAALARFEDVGIRRISIDDIARAAGVGRGKDRLVRSFYSGSSQRRRHASEPGSPRPTTSRPD